MKNLNENFWILTIISLKHVPYGLIDNMTVLVQIIIWTNDGVGSWRIYVSLGLNELNL